MRDASIITIILIALFLVMGYVYNVMSPYFTKLGLIDEQYASTGSDGGIFRSVDFGRSWTQVGDSGENIKKSEIFNIAFDANEPNVLRISSSSGFYESRDAGKTWNFVISGVLSQGESVTSFAIDPKNSNRIYVAAYSKSGRGRILKSKEGGFYEVYSTISQDDKVLGVWVDTYDPSVVYAGTEKGLFLESKDFGESWRVKKEFGESVDNLYMLPSDTRIMYAQITGKIFKTNNRGQSWIDITLPMANQYGKDFAVRKIAIDLYDETRIYVASSKGLWRSDNSGASFFRVELLSSGEDPEVSAIGLDPSSKDTVYIGVNAQIQKTADGGKNWQIKKLDTTRKINAIKVKPDDSSIIFVGVK